MLVAMGRHRAVGVVGLGRMGLTLASGFSRAVERNSSSRRVCTP